MLSGTIRKAHVGTAAGGIVDVICREHGGGLLPFFNDVQRLVNAYFLVRDHHVGIERHARRGGAPRRHVAPGKATRLCEDIQREISHDVPPGMATAGHPRPPVQDAHANGRHRQRAPPRVQLHPTHGHRGIKGTFINLSQLCGVLGQQSLEGRRIVAEKGERTLPCFAAGDVGLASRGFVSNSIGLGLALEVFFRAVGDARASSTPP